MLCYAQPRNAHVIESGGVRFSFLCGGGNGGALTDAVDNAKAYIAEQANDVLTVRMDNVLDGWEQWFLLLSDVHWDNPHCRRDILHRLLGQAKDRKAGVFIFGDLFCLMQGKYDPRASKDSIRPEHQVNNYLDAVVDTAVADFAPYADNLEMVTPGNHETSILKRQETDVIQRFAARLGVRAGGYSGFVRFQFSRGSSNRHSHVLYFHHGYAGGGPVTRGTIQTSRRSVYLPDPTFLVSGHIHENWVMAVPRVRISSNGRVYQDEQLHIQLPTLKDEYTMAGGWHVEQGRPPKPLGGAWLHFFYDTHARGNVGYQVLRAL